MYVMMCIILCRAQPTWVPTWHQPTEAQHSYSLGRAGDQASHNRPTVTQLGTMKIFWALNQAVFSFFYATYLHFLSNHLEAYFWKPIDVRIKQVTDQIQSIDLKDTGFFATLTIFHICTLIQELWLYLNSQKNNSRIIITGVTEYSHSIYLL